jgi:hypothetical protein
VKLLPFAVAFAAGATFVAGVGGCAHLQGGSVPVVTPTPSVTSTPSAAPCVLTPAANAQIVAMSPLITPVNDPTYGIIAGYGLVVNGSVANYAAPIVVTPSSTVQFFDNDETGSQLRYSAVGIPGVTAFPSPSFTFPPAATAQTGSVINGTTTWSTGLLAGQCYSQPFTINAAGTYFFGDYNYYGLGNIRDVIVATASPSAN